MTTFIATNIDRAIEDSIREGGSVVLTARVATQEWVNLVSELQARATDWDRITTDDSTIVESREYRGVDIDGDAWTIQAHAL